MFTNSGIFTARLAAVAFSIRIAGLSLPSSSMCVRYICVYGDRLFEENTSQRPLGEKLCQEFISGVLRACAAPPPLGGRHDVELAVGAHQQAVAAWTKTIQRPSGETLGKGVAHPVRDAPAIGSALPPWPPLNGTR
jgi:hypothetical protein